MNKPNPPIEPDYDKLIQNELNKLGKNTILSLENKQNKTIKIKNSALSYKNPAYNDAVVEAFQTSVQSKIKSAYFQYLRELEEYEDQLNLYMDELIKEENKLKEQEKLLKIDFDTAKTFYLNFQDLVKSKYNFISDFIKSALRKEKGDVEDSEKK